ncbi:MAG: ADOP family duplicated permease [Vicinamibacterales bacterium]
MTDRPLRWFRRLAGLFTWSARDRDMDQEMAFHIESMTHEYVRSGLSEVEAERAARRRFGNVTRLKEQGHDLRTARLVDDVSRDVRHMGRGLRRSPGFATAVILTLALGIGGNTAIFSVVDQVLLRPLPYPAGDQLVRIYETGLAGAPAGQMSVSPANWLDWQRDSRTFQAFAAWRTFSFTLTGVGEPTRVNAQLVSSEFFPLLGVKPLLGRTISEQDDRPNAPLVAVLSHELWQRRFAGDPKVIGHIIQINDRPVEMIGVMPAGFRFVYQDNDMWGAYRLDRNQRWRETAGRFINVVARLEEGTTIAAAQAEMEGLAQRLAATHAFNKNTTVALVPLREELTGQVSTSLVALYAAVWVLLSIACFNVASLLLARAASRHREIAIRASLGAGRLAIVRQLMVESLLLAMAGGAVGIALARWSLDLLVAFAPADLLRVLELSVDRRVLVYAVGLSVLTGVVVGLVPAILVARRSIVAALRAGGSSVTQSARVRQTLVVCQVAMTVVLLCGAGLLVQTVIALNRANSGFDKQGVLTMEIGLPGTRYTPERRVAFYREAVAALRGLPGVESAAAANSLAVIGTPRGGTVFHRLGTPELPLNDRPVAVIRVVTPGYFRTLRIPVLRGREFTEADDANPAAGFIVNEAFAKRFLSDVDPLGASLSVFMEDRENPHLPVIGVVGDVSEGSVRDNPQPTVFYSHRRMRESGMTLFVRTGQPEALAKPAVAALHEIDPTLAVTKIRTFESALAESLARERLSALVSGGFALSGLLLASLGLYGLLAFLVAERTREIGIRIALGAHLGRLTGSVIGGGLRLVGIGAAIGVGGSLLVLRSFGTLLFGVTPYDLSTYATVLALFCAVAALASYMPARRAARVEPLVALRQE